MRRLCRYFVGPCIIITALFADWRLQSATAAELYMNFVAVNPKDTSIENYEVRFDLPRELSREDILETSGLQVMYDVDNDRHYLFGRLTFSPRETKTFRIKINDVWRLDPDEIEVLKQQMDSQLDALKQTDDFQKAKALMDAWRAELDQMLATQNSEELDVNRRIKRFYAFQKRLAFIRKMLFNLEEIKRRTAIEQMSQGDKTLTLRVEVRNPEKQPAEYELKHYLPYEIGPDDVLDKQGFDIDYDPAKKRYYLTKKETFGPNEVKTYRFTLAYKWLFDPESLDVYQKTTDEAIAETIDTPYQSAAEFLAHRISNNIEAIRMRYRENIEGVENVIARHRWTQERIKSIEEDVDRLESLLAVVRAQKLKKLESKKVKNVLARLKALRGIRQLSEALFKKGITVTTTWRIIIGTIIFLAIFTAWHFIVWLRRSGRMGEDLAPKEGLQLVTPGSEGGTGTEKNQ